MNRKFEYYFSRCVTILQAMGVTENPTDDEVQAAAALEFVQSAPWRSGDEILQFLHEEDLQGASSGFKIDTGNGSIVMGFAYDISNHIPEIEKFLGAKLVRTVEEVSA